MPIHDGVVVTAAAVAVPSPATREPVLALALHVEHDAARAPIVGGPSESVDVVTGVFTTAGGGIGTLRQTLAVTPRGVAGGGVSYDILQRLPARPGRYELRIGLRNRARGQTGSVYTFVDVPDFRRLPFAVGSAAIYVTTGSPAMADHLEDVLPAPPTARRTFTRSERAMAFMRIYQEAPTGAVETAARILDEHNRRPYGQDARLEPSAFRNGYADYVVDLPLAGLAPGEYLLTIEARTTLASERRDVRFTVR
jgi:hypothetical protein